MCVIPEASSHRAGSAVGELDLSDRTLPFTPGETVVVAEVMNGKVWTVRPVTVIKDTADEIALWLAAGTLIRYPSGPQHGEHTVRQWIAGEWELRERRWDPPGKLRITRPGDAFDVWGSPGMHDDGTPWYVNLQDPLRRVGAGFTTMDHLLDLLVPPIWTRGNGRTKPSSGSRRRQGCSRHPAPPRYAR